MTQFVYSRVVTLREFVVAWAPDAPTALDHLNQCDEGDYYSADTAPDHDELLSTSPWELVSEASGTVCVVCKKDILDRPLVFGPYTVCAPCVQLVRDLREQRFIDTIAEIVNDRPTTPDEKARTEPPEHTPH